jgi:hypothetical protein
MQVYSLDIEKLKTTSIGPLAYLYKDIIIPEDAEYFEDIKHLLLIPEKRKSLDEIIEDHNKRFDNLIALTKIKYSCLESHLRNYRFPLWIICEGNVSLASSTPNCKLEIVNSTKDNVLIASGYSISWSKVEPDFKLAAVNPVGYYSLGSGLKFGVNKKPSIVERLLLKLLGFEWTDKK